MRFFLLILILLLNLHAKPFFSNTEQENTSKYIESLKNLILATQKTRGLTNSYLNGNKDVMLLIYSNRDEMKQAINKMKSLPLAKGDPVINAQASLITKTLLKLNHQAFKQPAQQNFTAYTEEIQQTLLLAQNISERFSKDLTPFGRAVSSLMMNTMLPMTEYTGELRGLGAGIAAKGIIKKEEQKQIHKLSSTLLILNKKLQKNMNKIIQQHSNKFSSTITKKLIIINKKLLDYITFAQETLSKNPKIVNSDQYFDQGTALISAIIQLYNTSNQAILEDSKGWF
jgi:hypothetical protein